MRGLLAIECLYHQIVKGNKTQTRREGSLKIINNTPYSWEIVGSVTSQLNGIGKPNVIELTFETVEFVPSECGLIAGKLRETCKPRYKVGEVLYLKEPFRSPAHHVFWYKYMMPTEHQHYKWSNKLFMPAAAARAFVRITGIKCERLLDISYDDAIAEGIELFPSETHRYVDYLNFNRVCNPRESFISLYKFANKVKEVPNIWCWCYSFEYLKDYKNDR